MATLPIRKFGDPVLRERAREVEAVSDLHRHLVKDMLETMRQTGNGVGLAGNQVGVLDRIFVWEVEDEHGTVINPVITERSSETVEGDEGCLSIPGIYYPVVRSISVTVEGINEAGEPLTIEATEFFARVCQHEIDHLDGVLFIDRLTDERRRQALAEIRDQALGLRPVPRPNEDAL